MDFSRIGRVACGERFRVIETASNVCTNICVARSLETNQAGSASTVLDEMRARNKSCIDAYIMILRYNQLPDSVLKELRQKRSPKLDKACNTLCYIERKTKRKDTPFWHRKSILKIFKDDTSLSEC